MAETTTSDPRARDGEARLTAAALKVRGWTDALISDLLGAPDRLGTNLHHRSGPPMRLYDIGRVEAAEGSAAWAMRIDAARRRSEGAARAVETKRAQLRSRLESVTITIPVLAVSKLIRVACDHYNQRQYDRGNFDGWDATPASDPAFLQRISVNFLRHAMSDYDVELLNIFGSVCVGEGYKEINRKAFAAIGSAYPSLTAECQRQFGRKFGGD